MAKATINSGICGFQTVVHASSEDQQHVMVRIETGCPNLKPLEAEPIEVDAFAESFTKVGDSPLFQTFRTHCKHPGCPVFSGMIKAVEVAAGLALPKDAEIHLSKEEN